MYANDGSDGAKYALKVAIDLARRYKAELHSISVEENIPHYAATIGEVDEFRKEADEFFGKINNEAIALAKKEEIELHTHVQAGHEVEAIVNFAKRNFDLSSSASWDIRRYSAGSGVRPRRNCKALTCTVVVVK
jgi:nucleotide-binding universal stress UspA family protein